MMNNDKNTNFTICECGKQENQMSNYNWHLHITSCVARKSKLTNKNISSFFSKMPSK